PTPLFAEEGARLETATWRNAAAFFNPALRNFCGPYTRSYHPDATRSVTLFSLWLWALFGRDAAPLPLLDSDVVDHSHDLMAGPLVARLATPPEGVDLATFTEPLTEARVVVQNLPNERTVTAHVEPSLMLGAESSPHDWGGWSQFVPVTAHWAEGDEIGVLWLLAPRRTRATVRGRSIELGCQLPLEFRLLAPMCIALSDGFETGAVRVNTDPDVIVTVAAVEPGDFRVFVAALTEDEPGDPVGDERRLVLTFDLDGDRAGDIDRIAL
ncbi:MAG TPA: hypothetical protein VNB24_01875, partial [Acidimicrobiales bacterium]|nr:hypothetical protein [Acidimicrobiales bacterium]